LEPPLETDSGQLVGYARVSTADQSLELQIAALERYGVPTENIWKEKRSALAKRVQLERCIAFLEPGDTLVVWKLDRFARSTLDLYQRLGALQQRGIKFVSLTDNIDMSTASGRLLFGVLAALAEFERDLIAERTKAGVRRKMEGGWRPGPEIKFTQEMRDHAQRLRDKGHTAPQIIDALSKRYKVKVSRRSIYLRTTRKP